MADKEFVSNRVLTSEELRAVALTASTRRGVSVVRRRLVWRWSAWLVWQWLLPMIGLTTVLAVLLVLASLKWWGPTKVFDTTQTWLAKHMTPPKAMVLPGRFGDTTDNHSSNVPNSPAAPGVTPQLQIDRNYSSHDQGRTATLPESNVTPVAQKPSSPLIPPGAQQ